MALARHVAASLRSNVLNCIAKPSCTGVLTTKFKLRMDEYLASSTANAIFTDDLRTMLHIATTDEDLKTTVNMIKRYAQQKTSLQLTSFTFGPVIMRLLYSIGKPAVALELYLSPELKTLFQRQATTVTLLMDLLFEHGMYADALKTYDGAGVGKPDGLDYLPNVVTLALASCYKINTPDSLQKMKDIVRGNKMAGKDISNRSIALACSLALNQNDPHTALEIVQLAKTRRFLSHNVRVKAFAALNRLEDALPAATYLADLGKSRGFPTFFPDTLAKLGVAVEAKGTAADKKQFESIKATTEEYKLVRTEPLETFMVSEIKPPLRDANVGGEENDRFAGRPGRSRTFRSNRDEEALDEEPVKGVAN